MNTNLGAIPLSTDILAKANIGLWAFELDDGKAPRMYVDDTMLGLLGLKEQISPELTYHAWYDNIDINSYDLIAETVEKMTNGVHAEVQYPWHNPDGRTMIVRCGGVRNFSYKQGVRIEGTHIDVTEITHLENLRHIPSKLQIDALTYISENNATAKEFLNFFSHRILELIECDEVIYNDSAYDISVITSKNSTENFDKRSFCKKCPFHDNTQDFYNNGHIIMNDCSKGYNNIFPHKQCPMKSSFFQRVYIGGKTAGILIIHYINKKHIFTTEEIDLLDSIAKILGILLQKLEIEEEAKKRGNIVNALGQDFDIITYVTLYDKREDDEVALEYRSSKLINSIIPGYENEIHFTQRLKLINQYIVHPEDRKKFSLLTQKKVVLNELQNKDTVFVGFRVLIEEKELFYQLKFTAIKDENNKITNLIVCLHNIDDLTRRVLKDELKIHEQNEKLETILKLNKASSWSSDIDENGDTVNVKWSKGMKNALGYNQNEEIDVSEEYTNNFHPQDYKYAYNSFKKITQSNKNKNYYECEMRNHS